MVVMGFRNMDPEAWVSSSTSNGLWDCGKGRLSPRGEKKPHPGGLTYIGVQCAQAETLLWALVGRVVSFPVYPIVSMLFCFFPLHWKK